VSFAVKNIFSNLPEVLDSEQFLTLFQNAFAKIERIVSHSHSSPPGFWYDQDEDEWLVVLRGSATLEFTNEEVVDLKAGDCLTIARRSKHRVARTSEETIWLAVFTK
jgi:cupin 2 domain-containing protein